MNIQSFRDLTASVIGEKKWLILADNDQSAHHFAQQLLDLGAADVMVLAATRDAAPKAVEPRYRRTDLGTDGNAGSLGHIRSCLAAFRNLPERTRAEIDLWDPKSEAFVLTPFWAEDLPVHGRAVFGARWPKWQQLENKMTCDAIWDALDIPRAPARILPVYQAALQTAHQELDQGMGTVWAGDNKEGWHGGAEYIRWIRTDREFRSAFPFFRSHCEQIRIQPFLNGIPCSIHGLVYPEYVVAFRPCEMLVFRQPGSTRFKYAGAATSWDPPHADRQYMRQIAKRVGAFLRERHSYRGAFTIDGVMTKDGFRPTELNPRYGAAIPRLTAGVPELPMYLLNKIVCEGIELPYSAKQLEDTVVHAADSHRVVWAGFSLSSVNPTRRSTEHFRRTDGFWRKAETESDAKVELTPSGNGAYLRVTITPDVARVGFSEASAIAELVKLTSTSMQHGLDDLEPAPTVRS